MKVLTNHTSPETAYVVDDYPYGFRVRTSIRYWIDTSDTYGQRCVSQTLNPKTGEWNKPKASTYTSFAVLFIDESNGHVKWAGWHPYSGADALREFVEKYGGGLPAERLNYAQILVKKFDLYEASRQGRAA